MNIKSSCYCLVLLLLSILILPGCGTTKSTFTDTISSYNKDALLSQKFPADEKSYPELKDLIGDSVSIFTTSLDRRVSRETLAALHHRVSDNLKSYSLYERFLSDVELDSKLKKQKQFAQARDIYIDSLSVVSVSDKDISNPLGRYLNVENFVLFQLDKWPCEDCKTPIMRMKIKVVDAKSGYIVWTAIAENRKLSKKEKNDISGLANDLADSLTKGLYYTFKRKWHRKRFEELAKLSG